MLLGALEVLWSVHRDPQALVPEGEQLAFLGELGEGRLLVVAALRQPLERLVVEHVDAGVHPMREPRCFVKAADTVAVRQLDDAELRLQRRDHDGRCAFILLVRVEEGTQVDVVELVAVERIQRARLVAMLGREAQASPTPERLRLRDGDDLCAQARELRLEQRRLPGAAADDHPLDTSAHELRDLVLRKWVPRDGDERLRMTPRRIAEARRLAAREDDRLH